MHLSHAMDMQFRQSQPQFESTLRIAFHSNERDSYENHAPKRC
jgi:hypothetical protein